MKGAAMSVVVGGVVTVAGAGTCSVPIPKDHQQRGAQTDSVSFNVSESCCHALHDAMQVPLPRYTMQNNPLYIASKADLGGKCGRADQVDIHKNWAASTFASLDFAGPGDKGRGKGCDNVAAKNGTDGAGKCGIKKVECKGKGNQWDPKSEPMVFEIDGFEIDGVSTGCCDAVNDVAKAIIIGNLAMVCTFDREKGLKAAEEAACGIIGACGTRDQLGLMKMGKPWKAMMHRARNAHYPRHPGELELLETFNMTHGGALQMMATFMTSEAEEDVTEDGATADGSHIVAGLLGFVAGAAVTGLGVTVLRRRTPSSQYEYNEIVA